MKKAGHCSFLIVLFTSMLLRAGSAAAALSPNSPCSHVPHENLPTASLSNGQLDIVLFLPDKENGYYRGSRFDWSGLVACASFAGHRYFGEWTEGYDPRRNDAVVGPVEEFRTPEGNEPGYAEAGTGGAFVKVGVGLLQRIDASPYRFGAAYPLLDSGVWRTTLHKHSVVFTQTLHTPLGFAYEYTKTLTIDRRRPVLKLKHVLKNLGAKPISTEVYDHDFFVFDDHTIDAGIRVSLGFSPIVPQPLGSAVRLQGNSLTFVRTPSRTDTAQGYLQGFTGQGGEYRIELRDPNTGVRVTQSSQSAISRFYFWSTRRTVCPEAYIPLHLLAGAKQRWEIAYTFGTLNSEARKQAQGTITGSP